MANRRLYDLEIQLKGERGRSRLESAPSLSIKHVCLAGKSTEGVARRAGRLSAL